MPRRLMLPHPDRFRPQPARHDPAFPAGFRIGHDLELIRQQPEKLPVQRAEEIRPGDVGRPCCGQPRFHLPLDGDVGQAFQLQAAPGRLGVVLLLHGPDDVVGVGVVPFDEVGVVAVDDPEQFAEGLQGDRVQPGAERRRALDYLQGQILKVIGPFREQRVIRLMASVMSMFHIADIYADDYAVQ